jgi:hypothetical protein
MVAGIRCDIREICWRPASAIKLQLRKLNLRRLNSNLAAERSKVPHLQEFPAFQTRS